MFSGPGSGKSTLIQRLARTPDFDTVVVGLVGERGREVRAFVDEVLADDPVQRARTVLVVATSDMPAQLRVACAFTATTIAEYFRAQGERVLLAIDSLTRVARAQREVGLAIGEPPVRRGFPPSLAGLLARLIERAGTSAEGSVTALYSCSPKGAMWRTTPSATRCAASWTAISASRPGSQSAVTTPQSTCSPPSRASPAS